MKIDCGPSADEIKRLQQRRKDIAYQKEHTRRENWQKIFAWSPIRLTSDGCRWLEFVYVKEKYHKGNFVPPLDEDVETGERIFVPAYWTKEILSKKQYQILCSRRRR